ncbi:sugar ABC transporter substrate-binding protein [Brachybacterium ginsengisoli]|uniref:Sugar ABC transporter substrate-binding protein n=1 Tax=Brachybacterium ginsengisoli TaxID=1331682 RepID=A0A291H144_9MICO|nr:extracellular solute-binding protein [Brachybacterium ginsengisoli]ATG56183.1 sugar ABC transporter substrate-binding protein [Brachybacterium ginsengisoli]
MFTRRKFLAAGSAALGTTLALGACSSGGGDEPVDVSDVSAGSMPDYGVGTTFTASEPFDLGLMYSDNPAYPYRKDWLFWEEITQRTNVTLKPTVIPMSDYEQKRSLLVSAGDAPYIIPKTYPGQETAFVAAGAILPISDYVDQMPNYMDKVTRWKLESDIERLKQQDGKYYVLPGLHEEVWPDYTLAYRVDILEELGLEEPTTWDELADVYRKVREAHPDMWPLSDRFAGANLLGLVAATYGVSAGWGFGDGVVRSEEGSDELVFGPQQDAFLAMLEWFSTGVEEKLIDTEGFTQDDDAALRKFVTGKSFSISTNSQTIIDCRKGLDEELGKGRAVVKKMLLPGGPLGAVMGGSRLENGVMFNAQMAEDDKFLAMLQFIDWLWYSDEGQEFSKWGVEGVTYEREGDKRVPAKDVTFLGLNPDGAKDLRTDFGFSGGVFSYGGTTDLLRSTMNEEEVDWQERTAKTHEALEPLPPYPMDEIQREEATLVATPLKDFVDQGTLKFVTGQRDVGEWDAFATECDDNGASKYMDIVREAQKAFAG